MKKKNVPSIDPYQSLQNIPNSIRESTSRYSRSKKNIHKFGWVSTEEPETYESKKSYSNLG